MASCRTSEIPVAFSIEVSRGLETTAKFFDKLRLGKIGKCITRADCVPVSCTQYAGSLVMARAPESIDVIIRSHPGYADDLQFGRKGDE
jgi:hypothetical protein